MNLHGIPLSQIMDVKMGVCIGRLRKQRKCFLESRGKFHCFSKSECFKGMGSNICGDEGQR